MRKVQGYRLEIIELQSFEIPIASDILSVTYDRLTKRPVLLVRQDEDTTSQPQRMIQIIMTGSGGLIPDSSNYIGSCTLPSGFAPMHFFEGWVGGNVVDFKGTG